MTTLLASRVTRIQLLGYTSSMKLSLGLEDVNDDVQGLLKAYGFTENSVYFSLSLKCISQYLTILTVI